MASNSDNHENIESKDDGQQIDMLSSNDELQDEQKPKKKKVHQGAKARKAIQVSNRLAKKVKLNKAAEELQQGKFKSLWYVSIVS